MIDIHCHLLPGVDDGVADLAMARAVCELAVADGTRAIVATPHQRHPGWFNGDRSLLEQRFEELQAAVGDLLTVKLGAEVHVDPGFLQELDQASDSQILSLAGSRYLLVEFPRFEPRLSPEEVLHEIDLAGYRPIVAHPEFIPYLADDLPRLERLVADGALLQVTAMCVAGEAGRAASRSVWQMLSEGWVHFVASDAHSPQWRPPGLSAAFRALSAELGEPVATLLTSTNPASVLDDRALNSPPTL